jgi:hypothetical protein
MYLAHGHPYNLENVQFQQLEFTWDYVQCGAAPTQARIRGKEWGIIFGGLFAYS